MDNERAQHLQEENCRLKEANVQISKLLMRARTEVRDLRDIQRIQARSGIQAKRVGFGNTGESSARVGIARRLDGISIADVLENAGFSIEILLQMKQDEVEKLIRETNLLHAFGRCLFEASHPEADGGKEEGLFLLTPKPRPKLTRQTTRSKFRQTLSEVIGPQVPGKTWQQEWIEMITERALQLGFASFEEYIQLKPYWASAQAFHSRKVKDGSHQIRLDAGFKAEQAQLIGLLTAHTVIAPMSQAIAENSDRYSSTTHALYNALAAKASQGKVAPKCYFYLTGAGSMTGAGATTGLADADPRWAHITEPDATGFRGMTTHGPLRMAQANEECYSPEGLREKMAGKYHTMDSTVICVESSAPEERVGMLHSAVYVGGNNYALPPLTLLQVTNIQKADEWEYLPGKYINQKCITVRPTYLLPAKQQISSDDISKFASDRSFLSYGNTQDAVRGTQDITTSPVLLMQQEWRRNDLWKDWKGHMYSAWREYQYVIRPVDSSKQRGEGSGLGKRDDGRDGFTVEMFQETINTHIRKKASVLQLDEPPLLSRAEVIAIRLYTGPGFVPLNTFLREVSKVGPDWRRKLSQMHQLTYSSTVLHIINGLRKLVRVNTEARATVYRGVRGELPEAFWLKDAFGMVTATDFAFMSTSVEKEVCVGYMSKEEKNVLWEIRCSEETCDGFHSGADVSLLSQFPAEREILFPPLTMLEVQSQGTKGVTAGNLAETTARGGQIYTHIVVRPSFV